MKKLLVFLIILINYIIPQNLLTIKGEPNVENFPEVRINFYYYYPEQLSKKDVKIIENFQEKRVKKLQAVPRFSENTNINVLILFERTAKRPMQNIFYRDFVLKEVIPNLTDNIKLNIALFDRIRPNKERLEFLLPHFTNNKEILLSKVETISYINDRYGNQKSTELYLAINDALEYLNKKYKSQNNIIIVFTAGYNLKYTNSPTQQELINKALKYKIPIYILQYLVYENRSLERLALDSYGLFEFTNNKEKAKNSLIKFLEEAPKRLLGYDYLLTYHTSYKEDGKIHTIILKVLTEEKELNFTSPCNFLCIIQKNIIILIIGIFLIILIVLGVWKLSKKKPVEYEYEEKVNASDVNNKTQISIPEVGKKKKEKPKISQDKIKNAYNGKFPRLYVIKNGKVLQEVVLQNGYYLIGRDKNADIKIEDKIISREHAEIIFQNNYFSIVDLNSTNGTYLNGVKIEPNFPYKITDRDTITLANAYNLEFHI